jgi:hypothetical protein
MELARVRKGRMLMEQVGQVGRIVEGSGTDDRSGPDRGVRIRCMIERKTDEKELVHGSNPDLHREPQVLHSLRQEVRRLLQTLNKDVLAYSPFPSKRNPSFSLPLDSRIEFP